MSSSALKASHASDAPVNFDALLQRLDQQSESTSSVQVQRFCFIYDGLNFDVRRIETKKGPRFLISATIGYLPFSIESAFRRDAVKTIIMASQSLPSVQFLVDASSRITAAVLFDALPIAVPDFIFYPLTLFMQEARPFIALIGKYLVASNAKDMENKPGA
jgi:hypothetical protein